MFLRCKVRRKDGKQHRYWSVVENTRVARGRVVQRHVLYLGEINDTQELAWRRSIEVLEDGASQPRTLSLFPEDRGAGALADASIVHVKLSQLQLRRPRQWGACWLALLLWRELQLDQFWSNRLGVSRKGTRWDQVLIALVVYRLLAPGSADPPVHYLVGTPKGRLTRLEKHLVAKPWQEARPGVQVKLLAQEGELYVLAQSRDRVAKERAMRRRQLKRLWTRLKQLSTMQLTREELLMKLGAARDQSRMAWRLAVIEVAADAATFSYRLDRDK